MEQCMLAVLAPAERQHVAMGVNPWEPVIPGIKTLKG